MDNVQDNSFTDYNVPSSETLRHHVENSFHWRKVFLQVVPLKMDKFGIRKQVSGNCENNINHKPSISRTKPGKISSNGCALIINYSSLLF